MDVALGSLRQSGAKGGDDVGHFFCHAGIGLSLGHVAPDAEHGAHGVLDGAAHEVVDVKLAGLVGGALVAAHDPIPVAVGVHQLVALLSQESGLGHVIAPPTGGPIADDDVLVEGALIGGVVVVDAVVEGHGSHAGLLDHGGHLIDVLDKVVVLAIGYQLGEAHAAGIVGVLVHTHVEEGAALAGEVGDVLLEERLGEAGGGLVGDVNGALRGAIGAVHTSEGLGSVQDGVHVAGGVDQRHDLHALGGGVGQDLVHLGLGELVHLKVAVSLVASVDGVGDLLVGVGSAAHGQGHVVQQEAHTVVAQTQHHIVHASGRSAVDDGLQAVHGEILTASVHHDDGLVVRALSGGCGGLPTALIGGSGGEQHAGSHCSRQQDGHSPFE